VKRQNADFYVTGKAHGLGVADRMGLGLPDVIVQAAE
jgi:hypothetical protein